MKLWIGSMPAAGQVSLPSGQPNVADFCGGVSATNSPFLSHWPKKVSRG